MTSIQFHFQRLNIVSELWPGFPINSNEAPTHPLSLVKLSITCPRWVPATAGTDFSLVLARAHHYLLMNHIIKLPSLEFTPHLFSFFPLVTSWADHRSSIHLLPIAIHCCPPWKLGPFLNSPVADRLLLPAIDTATSALT